MTKKFQIKDSDSDSDSADDWVLDLVAQDSVLVKFGLGRGKLNYSTIPHPSSLTFDKNHRIHFRSDSPNSKCSSFSTI